MKTNSRNRILASILMMLLILGQLQSAVLASEVSVAQSSQSPIVLTLGADLSGEQQQYILNFFGISIEQVKVVTITNADEKAQLGNIISDEQIGSKTLSCALIRLTTSGGVQVKAANLNFVDSKMIANALTTSGVYNCEVLTAAPFDVSGTGALTGVMMAYEAATGTALDPEKKELANEEMVLTGDIGETVGKDQATLVINKIKITVVRDGLTEDQQIQDTVDNAVEVTQQATEAQAQVLGTQAPQKLGQAEHEQLYSYGKKISQQDYQYQDMQRTLERVTYAASQDSGIDDPIIDTFTTLDEEVVLDPDSILLNSNDEALGENANVNATVKAALGEHEAERIEVFTGDPTLEESGKVKANSFIRRTNLIAYQDINGSYALMDLNGNLLSDSIYTQYFKGENGYVRAELNDGSGTDGFLSASGTILLPFEYPYVEAIGEKWAVGCTVLPATEDDYDLYISGGTYGYIDRADIYYFEDSNSVLAASLTRDQFRRARAFGEYLNIEDSTGLITTYDKDFNALRTTDYISDFGDLNEDSALIDLLYEQTRIQVYRFYYGYGKAMDYNNGMYGVMDRYGNMIIPAQYDNVSTTYDSDSVRIVSGGYFGVSIGGNFAYVIQDGVTTGTFSYPYDQVENYGMSALYESEDGSLTILSGDGVETALGTTYSSLRAISESDGMFWSAYRDDSNSYDLLDWHGNVLLTGCSNLSVSANGNYLIANDGYTSSTLYLINGASPVAIAESAGGAVEVEAAQQEAASLDVYTGDPVLEDTGYTAPAGQFILDCDLIASRDSESQYALFDPTGVQLTDYRYSEIDYENGWLKVSESAGEEPIWGLISVTGEEVIPCSYDTIEVLSSSWAVGYQVQETTDSEYDMFVSSIGYCNIESADVFYLPELTYVTLTKDQIEDVDADGEYLNVKDRTTGNVMTYDSTFTAIAAASSVSDFRDYSAEYVLERTIRDMTGYSIYNTFSNGYAIAASGDYCGVIDTNGEIIVPFEYDRIDYIKINDEYNYVVNGYFCVRKDDMWGYVTAGGEVSCELKYSSDDTYTITGMALAVHGSDETYTLVAADGTETTGFEYLYNLNETGMFWVGRTSEGSFLYDWHGNRLLSDIYGASVSESNRYIAVMESSGDENVKIYSIDGAEVIPAGGEISAAEKTEQGDAQKNSQAEDPVEEETEGQTQTVQSEAAAADEEETAGQGEANQTDAAEESNDSSDTSSNVDYDAVKALLTSVQTLVSSDPVQNRDSILTLLAQVQSALEGTDSPAVPIITSVVTLVESGTADTDSISTLINSALSLM